MGHLLPFPDDVDGSCAGWVNEDDLPIDPDGFSTRAQTPVHAWNDMAALRLARMDKDTLLPILKTEGNWLLAGLCGAVADQTGRQNGERFETTIMLEGMEETVHCEHIINTGHGIEMDYDYENFLRRSKADRECFVPLYGAPQEPTDDLKVAFSSQDADAAAECHTCCQWVYRGKGKMHDRRPRRLWGADRTHDEHFRLHQRTGTVRPDGSQYACDCRFTQQARGRFFPGLLCPCSPDALKACCTFMRHGTW